ncbi:MAG: alpha-L-fucosidase [Kiritimatiellae bacterium]|nr:alpha-L-fucosidase [Kiritimatiellia bacterium]
MNKTAALITVLLASVSLNAGEYEANWESLDRRPTPDWWRDAKLGVFIHWGIYSVPAFAPTTKQGEAGFYSEHYQHRIIDGEPVFSAHHRRLYGNRTYDSFAEDFTADAFDARAWARLFRRAGAGYVVLTAKHHDGFCLWPSRASRGRDAVKTGPKRDLCREFADAMRAEGLRRGFYYSLIEYENPLYDYAPGDRKKVDVTRFVRDVNLVQLHELTEAYEPDVIWPDGEWRNSDRELRSREFLAWLFNESPVKDYVAVNDRWGRIYADGVPTSEMKRTRGSHGGYYTTEYGRGAGSSDGIGAMAKVSDLHPWEECRGLGRSFGYNRYERADDYITAEALVHLFVRIVGGGGNLLINVGPDRHGFIPPIQEERLLQLGRWLKVNGEAIYGTRAWRGSPPPDVCREKGVFFTTKGGDVYAIATAWPKGPVEVRGVGGVESVAMVGVPAKVEWSETADGVRFEAPRLRPDEMPCEWAWCFKIAGKGK